MTVPRRPRVAFLSYSTGEFDSRTDRMARSAIAAGYDAVVYARLEPGLAAEESRGPYRIIRAPVVVGAVLPGRRGAALSRVAAIRAAATPGIAGGGPTSRAARGGGRLHRLKVASIGTPFEGPLEALARLVRPPRAVLSGLFMFPLRPIAWAIALESLAEPADLWHGMWAGSLPALVRLRGRSGGAAIYDSRDIYLHARHFDRMGRFRRRLYQAIERRWARACDAVLTVNEDYADILTRTLGVASPPVVMNCPERYDPPSPRPDRIRAALGLAPGTSVVLYQGNLMTERGIEEGMEAILSVPEAVLVLLGYGGYRDDYAARAARAPYAGRVRLLDAVPPSELLDWTASADVILMAIQPTTLNHRYTTPNKLWEALAAGVPVVASDLPGMARVVLETGCGVLCDPTDPTAIAAAIRGLLAADPAERDARREACLRAAHDRYNWEAQVTTLLDLYRRLVPAVPAT